MEHLVAIWNVIKDLVTLNLSAMQKHEWEIFQGYGFFLFVVFLSIVLYSYWYHLYRVERKNERNYGKYASPALGDDINDNVLESKRNA